MTGRLQSELRQSKPFACLEVEAVISVARTADALLRHLEEALKIAGLSPTQYNVLRILRGATPQGLACGEIAGRLITRDPDITRLLDRMEHRGLLERARETRDRRVENARSSAGGSTAQKIGTPRTPALKAADRAPGSRAGREAGRNTRIQKSATSVKAESATVAGDTRYA